MPKKTPKNVEYLRTHGPTPVSKLPGSQIRIADKMRGVTRLWPTNRSSGDMNSQGGHTEAVAYIMGEHDPEKIVRVFIRANPQWVEELTFHGAVQRIGNAGEEFGEAASKVLRETDIEKREVGDDAE